jgi:hypothetical protein
MGVPDDRRALQRDKKIDIVGLEDGEGGMVVD